MKPVSPVMIGFENNSLEKRIAENQPQYQTLPALPMRSDLPGTILTRWEISDEELEKLRETRSVYLYIATFMQPLQPVYLTVKPPVPEEVDEKYAEIAKNLIPDDQGPSANPMEVPIITEYEKQSRQVALEMAKANPERGWGYRAQENGEIIGEIIQKGEEVLISRF